MKPFAVSPHRTNASSASHDAVRSPNAPSATCARTASDASLSLALGEVAEPLVSAARAAEEQVRETQPGAGLGNLDPAAAAPETVESAPQPGALPLCKAAPAYERLWQNRCQDKQLTIAPEGRGLGRCECTQACNPGTCLNAALAIECFRGNCAFGDDRQRRCQNRQFSAAQTGALEQLTEVFYTGEAKGFGLRAARTLRGGQLVAEYLGDVVPKAKLQSWRYAMSLKAGVAVDASRAGGPGRLVNHSCAPNCYAQRWVVAGEWRVGLFTSRPVAQGQELTFSYAECGRGGFGEGRAPERCLCGESCCSGIIGAPPPKSSSMRRAAAQGPPAVRRGLKRRPRTHGKCGGPAAALAARRAAANSSGPPDWPHTRWLCDLLFGMPEEPPAKRRDVAHVHVAPVLRMRCSYRLEPWLVHTWPGAAELELARAAGLYLPRSLAVARRAWLQRVCSLPEMPPTLALRLKEAVLGGEPCAECGRRSSGSQPCAGCGRAVHTACAAKRGGHLREQDACVSSCAANTEGSVNPTSCGCAEPRPARIARVLARFRAAVADSPFEGQRQSEMEPAGRSVHSMAPP